MTKRNLRIVPLGTGWAVIPVGSNQFMVITTKQKDAIDYATEIAKKRRIQLIIHRRAGGVRKRNDYRVKPRA